MWEGGGSRSDDCRNRPARGAIRPAAGDVMIIPRVPVQHRRLLPDRRLSGPTPWVIAILMMLTLLAAAAGVGLARSANAIGEAIAGRVTVQIVTANPDRKSTRLNSRH